MGTDKPRDWPFISALVFESEVFRKDGIVIVLRCPKSEESCLPYDILRQASDNTRVKAWLHNRVRPKLQRGIEVEVIGPDGKPAQPWQTLGFLRDNYPL